METTSNQSSNPTDPKTSPTHHQVYIGTNFDDKESETLFHYRLNTETGELVFVNGIKAGKAPSYLTIDKNHTHLYASLGKEEKVKAFNIDPSSGVLSLLNAQDSPAGPCYISLDHTNKVAVTANYGVGSVCVFPLNEDGGLAPVSENVKHHGSSVNKDRQTSAHAHFIIADPTNKYALAIDLGMDKIVRYRLDVSNGKLISEEPQAAYVSRPGSGPRHLEFHPNQKYAYLIHELDGTMAALSYDANTGTFKEINTLPGLPEGWTGENTAAAVHLTPNGKFLYGSQRGHDSIVVYSVDEATGKIALVEHVSSQGKGPRDFEIDPSGKFMVVSNEKSSDVFVYSIDQETGRLTKTEHKAQVPQPVCVKIIANTL